MGTYSENIPKNIAKKLVENKEHFTFAQNIKGMLFWFSKGDKTLHYGRNALEGTIHLNKNGIKYLENYKKWQ